MVWNYMVGIKIARKCTGSNNVPGLKNREII
jgi:hypothetical protein